jgi:hypothetical protein
MFLALTAGDCVAWDGQLQSRVVQTTHPPASGLLQDVGARLEHFSSGNNHLPVRPWLCSVTLGASAMICDSYQGLPQVPHQSQ